MVIDRTEKPKIPSKFAERAGQYNEFGYKYKQCERNCTNGNDSCKVAWIQNSSKF